MTQTPDLDQTHYIRDRLFASESSSLSRYTSLVIGDESLWMLLKYELITTLLGPIPGALGLGLRKVFYPLLFPSLGKGVVFGRSVVIRHPKKMKIGDRVMIDDYVVLDARGADDAGFVIGEEVIVNRGASIQAKIGDIRVGSHTDIGAQSVIISQGGTYIGNMVTIGGGCKIGGGSVQMAPSETADGALEDPNDFRFRGQERLSRGAVRIADRTIFGRGVIVMDGVEIGEGSLIGTGAVIRQSVAASMAVIPQTQTTEIPRTQFVAAATEKNLPPPKDETPTQAESHGLEAAKRVVSRVLEEVNSQLPASKALSAAPECPLIEPAGPLDSMGLVNLLVATEQALVEVTGQAINVTSVLDQESNRKVFESVGSFARFIERVIGGEA